MPETKQRTIFGESINETVSITTTGRVIRPFKRMLDAFAKEYRVNIANDGLEVNVVDPANVGLIHTELDASAFERYSCEETTLGLSQDSLGTVLQHARYGISSDDTIRISADSRHIQSEVERTIGNSEVTVTERSSLIDPDSIRQEPELQDLEFSTQVDIDPSAFIEVIRMIDDGVKSNAGKIRTTSSSLIIQQEGDVEARDIEISADVSGVEENWTHYSPNYLTQIANAVNNGYIDDITLKFSEEFPIRVDFEREEMYSGHMMIAPQIRA